MITICKHQINPHCAIVEGLPFKHVVLVQKEGLSPVSISKLLRGLCYQHHKEPGSLLMCTTTKTFISLDSWDGVGSAVENLDSMCVCVWTQMVCWCEVKGVARVVKANCLLMSKPQEWMRTQMGFLSGGLFFWPSLPVFGETWKPRLELTGILLNEGRLRAFTRHRLNGIQGGAGCESCVCWVGVCWDEVSKQNGAINNCPLPFLLEAWKHVFKYSWSYWQTKFHYITLEYK